MPIRVDHPIYHIEYALDNSLPMSVVGDYLFIVENPGRSGDLRGGSFKFNFGASLQIIDLVKWRVTRTIYLRGMSDNVYWYKLFADGEHLYLKEGVDETREDEWLWTYNVSSRELIWAGSLPSKDAGPAPGYAFAVISHQVLYATPSGIKRIFLAAPTASVVLK